MMKKYTLLYSAVVALALVSCDYNEDNFDGFEDFGKPTDIKKGNITFTDWASLKGNPYLRKECGVLTPVFHDTPPSGHSIR